MTDGMPVTRKRGARLRSTCWRGVFLVYVLVVWDHSAGTATGVKNTVWGGLSRRAGGVMTARCQLLTDTSLVRADCRRHPTLTSTQCSPDAPFRLGDRSSPTVIIPCVNVNCGLEFQGRSGERW